MMNSTLQTYLKQALIIFCFLTSSFIKNSMAHTGAETNFYNDPPNAVCNTGQEQIDQNHDLTFGGQGSTFNFNNEGLHYPGQTITIGTAGFLTRVDTEFTPQNVVFGGTVILTIVDGANPNPPQTILATKTVIPTTLDVVIVLDTPIPVTAGQQLTLLFTGTVISPGGLVGEPNNADSYPGGDRWGTNNGGATWFGPFNEDIDFITYISAPLSISLGANGMANLAPILIDAGSNDDMTSPGDLSLGVSPAYFTCDDIGEVTATLTVADESGLTSSCIASVLINDDNNNCCSTPDAICKNIAVQLDANGEVAISPSNVDNGSTSPCGFGSMSLDIDFFDCLDFGTNAVTLTVTDVNGNEDSCIAQVQVSGLPCDWSVDPDGINCPGGNSANYDPISEVFTVSSEGCYNPSYYRSTDSHGFASIELCGDGEIITQVEGVLGAGWAGITMREGTGASEKMIQLMIDGSFLTRRELRLTTGGIAFNHLFPTQGKNWLRLTRSGNTFGAYQSPDGSSWSPVLITNINMASCINIGLITMNGSPIGALTGVFGHVQINTSAPLATPPTIDIAPTENYSPDFSVYPNPTAGIANIDLEQFQGESFRLNVYNNLGQIIYHKTYDYLEQNTELINLSDYHNGIYLISIELDDGSRFNKKLVVEKF